MLCGRDRRQNHTIHKDTKRFQGAKSAVKTISQGIEVRINQEIFLGNDL